MITLAITTYNRPEMTFDSFSNVLKDDRITEILIIDDHSDWDNFIKLKELCNGLKKVKVKRNEKNLGCYHNKRKAIVHSKNEWVIIFDSDNKMDVSYLDSLNNLNINQGTELLSPSYIYAPEFARPHFDYRGFTNQVIDKGNVSNYVSKPKFDCLINTCNYLVHKDTYLSVWKDHPEPWTADTLFMNYNWLMSGNKIRVVSGMQYDHLVHDGSHYKEHVNKTGNLANELMNKLKSL